MRDPDEDVCYEIARQKKLEASDAYTKQSISYDEYLKLKNTSIPWRQKVGTTVPFSRTVDRDQNPRIPLSIPQESPRVIEVWAWTIIAACVGLAYWWVAK